jgi:hypothetical protein
MSTEEIRLPPFNYYLDESDPGILILRRQDGSFVAHFSASGASREGIIEVAKEDYRELIQNQVAWGDHATEEHQKA